MLEIVNEIKSKPDKILEKLCEIQSGNSQKDILHELEKNRLQNDELREMSKKQQDTLKCLVAQINALSVDSRADYKTIAVGNPGSGKSTILNSLAQKLLFKSGVSIGIAMTYQFDRGESPNGVYFLSLIHI